MFKIKVGNREVEVNPTYAVLKYVTDKYDTKTMDTWPIFKYDEYIIDILWQIMCRKRFIKPFITYKRLAKAITVSEMMRLRIDINRLINGMNPLTDDEYNKIHESSTEDRNSKNV